MLQPAGHIAGEVSEFNWVAERMVLGETGVWGCAGTAAGNLGAEDSGELGSGILSHDWGGLRSLIESR